MSGRCIIRVRSAVLRICTGRYLVTAPPFKPDDDWPEQLAVRIARCYYELGMTQQAIASSLSIGRSRVIRLLAEARERGLVSISIHSPLLENEELCSELTQRYGLFMADVCLSHAGDEHVLARQVAAAACKSVQPYLVDDITIGVGWGITLKAFASQLRTETRRGVSVAALLGSLTRRSTMTRFEATTELAARLGAECLYLPAPIVCDSEESRRVLVEQPLFRNIQAVALAADLSLVSIGGLDSATIREAGLIDDHELERVQEQRAIGNFLGYYINAEGAIVDQEINRRIIGITGEHFRRIPRRIMISAGSAKVEAMHAVLTRGFVNGLVTDQQTARALLAMPAG